MGTSTILYDDRVSEGINASADGAHLWLTAADLTKATGWKVEPEGLCRGDACVRTQAAWTDSQGRVDLAAFAKYMGQPMLSDGQAYAFGESLGNRRDSLFSLEAPDFTLPDIDGKLHKLSDFRGKKVFMYSWGSY
ncbi:MAG: hypothetical protein IT492_00660 [Gammaproteobacteria bacterium]|nr:hypothetical protein [Gammaproteobacteria bacterium]